MRVPAALLVAAALIAGCGKTEKGGKVGETFEAGEVSVTVQRVDPDPPIRSDVTGLGRPAPGRGLVGVRVRACVGEGRAIGVSDFGLEVSDGNARVKFPTTNYRDRFASVFAGDCGEGWIVFEASAGAGFQAVTFSYDDTGSARPGDRSETHARFRWG